ncbi:hypothetical protein HIM_05288 [Hirsutella minnesotensis 3608]|uniref:Aminotransferase class I/classII large domain-containing protein n=1 Tax=Hirsutella minnesotensis 3608 TaxID=1043627 RepID=A0A0F8A0I4_9HYPO|nr:hypothetical protein HIM_05288 [Hirsutella minnesotensis 3608]
MRLKYIPWWHRAGKASSYISRKFSLYTERSSNLAAKQLPRSFSRSLEAGLEKRQQQDQYFRLLPPANQLGLVDIGSNDSLCLRHNRSVRQRFLDTLSADADFVLGAGGSRVLDGSNRHVMQLERYLADYHGADDGLLFNSGYEANVAIYSKLLHPGDAVVHDEMIHASMHDGIRAGRASTIKAFAHNDVDALGQAVEDIRKSQSAIHRGSNTVFVVFESFYSMEGDMAPVLEMVAKVRSILPEGNVVFIIDEAHSTGLIGPHGSGYIRHLGLENEGIIQMHSYAKAPGALGGSYIPMRAQQKG